MNSSPSSKAPFDFEVNEAIRCGLKNVVNKKALLWDWCGFRVPSSAWQFLPRHYITFHVWKRQKEENSEWWLAPSRISIEKNRKEENYLRQFRWYKIILYCRRFYEQSFMQMFQAAVTLNKFVFLRYVVEEQFFCRRSKCLVSKSWVQEKVLSEILCCRFGLLHVCNWWKLVKNTFLLSTNLRRVQGKFPSHSNRP